MCNCKTCDKCEARIWRKLEARMKRNVRRDIEEAKRMMASRRITIHLN